MARNAERLYGLIGARIRAARERIEPKLSQATLAKKVDMSRASIVNIEAGRQHPPLHVLWQLAEVLSVEAAALIPSHAEYIEDGEPIKLDSESVRKIEEAANGDPATRRLLSQFVSRNKPSTSEPQ